MEAFCWACLFFWHRLGSPRILTQTLLQVDAFY